MAFVVDGRDWQFDDWTPEALEATLESIIERIEIAQSRLERVWVGDDLQTRGVHGTLTLWELWSPDSPIALPRELSEELAAALSHVHRYLDETDWPPDLDETMIRVGDEAPAENADIAWAHHAVRSGRAVACLGLRRRGVELTHSNRGTVSIHWVSDEASCRAFFRDAIDVERDSEATLKRLAPHAFPDLLFIPSIWRGVGDFAGGYEAVRRGLRRYLAALDDHGAWAFTAAPPALTRGESVPLAAAGLPSIQLVERRFGALGLTMAPEKPEVRSNRECREAREVSLGKRLLYCEWHGKLEPHQNRVHVHPPVAESSGRVIVAIFHEHLPLPS